MALDALRDHNWTSYKASLLMIYVDQNKIRPDISVSIIFPIPPSENDLDMCQQVADY